MTRPRLFLTLLAGFVPATLAAGVPVFELAIKEHRFVPAELKIPAGQKVKLRVINHDSAPEEFESHSLNREKVVIGHSEAAVFVGPLKPGTYEFFGEFNPETALGRLVVE